MKILSIFILLISFKTLAGRYEFHMNQQYPNRSIMIDSQTGKIWQPTCYTEQSNGDCEVKAWAPNPVLGINITENELNKAIEEHNKAKK